jgi:hypothetical protein
MSVSRCLQFLALEIGTSSLELRERLEKPPQGPGVARCPLPALLAQSKEDVLGEESGRFTS